MKTFYILAIITVFLAWSCNSDETEEANNNTIDNTEESDNKKIVDQTPDNKETFRAEAPKINEKFKSFLSKFGTTKLPYTEAPDGTEEFKKIPLEDQIEYLAEPEEMPASEFEEQAESIDYYFVSSPISTDTYHAIVYGRFEMGYVYYYLCTYNNDGKLISNISFATYEFISIGPDAGQERHTKGTISKNLEIAVKSDEETREYKIQDDGKIVRQ